VAPGSLQPVTPDRARVVVYEAKLRHGEDWERYVERYLHPPERVYLLTRARDEGVHWLDVLEAIRTERRQNPLGTLAGIAALFAMFPITPVVAGAAALHNHIKNGRKKNPLDPEAFAPYLEREAEGRHKADWTPHKMEEALQIAAERFVVELAGPLYGCGSYGCAAPLVDGRVLKVTIDDLEARWARLTHEHGVPGMVHVDVPPTVVAEDDWYQGEGPEPGDEEPPVDPFEIWAYVREAAADLPDELWRSLPLRGLPSRSEWRAPGMDEVYEGIEAFYRLGYELVDWQNRYNIGLDRDGKIVVRDGRLTR
jgi:hypothetical protein